MQIISTFLNLLFCLIYLCLYGVFIIILIPVIVVVLIINKIFKLGL